MTSGHIGSSRDNRRRWTTLALVAGCLSLSACASMAKVSTDATTILQTHIVRPVRYRLAGADPDARANLSRGQRELQAKNYPGALAALNRAVWDVEGIQRRPLRLTELGDVYEALRRAYTGLGMPKVAEEHLRMAIALTEARARDQAAEPSHVLARAKDAYAAARFRDALRLLRAALVDLEDLSDGEMRVKHLAPCHAPRSRDGAIERQRCRDEPCRQDPPAERGLLLDRGLDGFNLDSTRRRRASNPNDGRAARRRGRDGRCRGG